MARSGEKTINIVVSDRIAALFSAKATLEAPVTEPLTIAALKARFEAATVVREDACRRFWSARMEALRVGDGHPNYPHLKVVWADRLHHYHDCCDLYIATGEALNAALDAEILTDGKEFGDGDDLESGLPCGGCNVCMDCVRAGEAQLAAVGAETEAENRAAAAQSGYGTAAEEEDIPLSYKHDMSWNWGVQ